MALSIGVKKGSRISIGPARDVVEVVEILPDNRLVLAFGGKTMEVSDQERVLLAPDVYVFCGRDARDRPVSNNRRLAFEAPRSIRIERVPS